MQQLILFLSKYRNTLLLIVLLTLAMFRHSAKNPVAEHRLNSFGFGALANVHDLLFGWKYYWSLDDVNAELARENAALRAALYGGEAVAFSNSNAYQYIPSKAVAYSYNKHNNYITLNVGKSDGVRPGMGVISSVGWIGTVNETSLSYSSVVPLLHENGTIGARIKGKGLGTLHWTFTDAALATLTDVQREFEPVAGDSVFTFTRAEVAPPTWVGMVRSAVQNPEDLTWKAEVELATDYRNLDWVYVCSLKDAQSLDSLNTQVR